MAGHGPSWPVVAQSLSHLPLLHMSLTATRHAHRAGRTGMHVCRGTETRSRHEPMPLLPGQRRLTQARSWHPWHGHGMSMSTGKQLAADVSAGAKCFVSATSFAWDSRQTGRIQTLVLGSSGLGCCKHCVCCASGWLARGSTVASRSRAHNTKEQSVAKDAANLNSHSPRRE